ncbi:hypothetical protein Q7A53_07555 [Halobacillus rhizosphaerae]|uniref:hypothetical protein n=1 Tax=Halobacillus rhizosphaerae TaxID=3064889 RepID=UPI00398A74BC
MTKYILQVVRVLSVLLLVYCLSQVMKNTYSLELNGMVFGLILAVITTIGIEFFYNDGNEDG